MQRGRAIIHASSFNGVFRFFPGCWPDHKVTPFIVQNLLNECEMKYILRLRCAASCVTCKSVAAPFRKRARGQYNSGGNNLHGLVLNRHVSATEVYM